MKRYSIGVLRAVMIENGLKSYGSNWKLYRNRKTYYSVRLELFYIIYILIPFWIGMYTKTTLKLVIRVDLLQTRKWIVKYVLNRRIMIVLHSICKFIC